MNIEVLYWGRPSEFFPTLFQLNEEESFLDIKIITESISPYGVHPTTATVHVKSQNGPEIYIGTLVLDYLILHGGLTKDFLDLAWCIDRAQSKQAGLPITINPALVFQAPTPPVSGDEESGEEGRIDSRGASLVEPEVPPPPVAADEHSEDEILEISSDEEIEEEESSFESQAQPQATFEENAEYEDELEPYQEPEAGVTPDEYEENEGGDIHDVDESQSTEYSPDDKGEDLNGQIASMELIVSELRQDRRQRQNLNLAIKQLDELQEKAKNHTAKQRNVKLQPSDTSTATKKPEIARGKSPGLILQMFPDAGKIPSTPPTPSTPQGNKRKAEDDTPPFSSPNKRVKTHETGGFGTNRTSPHTPPRDLKYFEDEDSDDTVNYSENMDSEDEDEYSVDEDEDSGDEDSGDEDEYNDNDDFGATGGKTLLPPSDNDDDSEDEEDDDFGAIRGKTLLLSDNDDDSEEDEEDEDDDGYPATGGKSTALPPVKPQRAGAFSPAEHNALHRLIVNLRVDEQNRGLEEKDRLKDTKLYAKLSTQMRGLGFERSPGSCKNYWNRYGRALSGYDERIGKIKNLSLVTSAQN